MTGDPSRFLNRSDELGMLEDRWRAGSAEFFVLYGRRRVGKTELLDRFAQGKRSLFFEATASKEVDHLDDLSTLLADLTGDPVLAQQGLQSWEAVLAAIGREAESGPLVVVLDEFQYVARETVDIGSRLSNFWRSKGRSLPLFLILSGSDVSFFENDVMGYNAATYGRRTGSHRLQPFRPREVSLFVPSWDPSDLVRAYSALGGMPYYLDALTESEGFAENLWRLVFAPGSLLREEPEFLFSQEGRIRDRRPYFTTLRAIAAGRTKNNEIAQRVTAGDASAATGYLVTLQEMGLINREHPVTVANPDRTKSSRYSIADPFLRFWFRLLLPYIGRLRTATGARRHLDEFVLPRLDEFVSAPGFEEVCQAWMETEVAGAATGRWWGKLRRTTSEGPRTIDAEADVVSVDPDGEVLALGSCKWTNGKHPDSARRKLEEIADEICIRGEHPRFYFFSREGFDETLQAKALAEPERYLLVSPSELFSNQ